MVVLDEKNCRILNLLQEDCRMSFTEIGRRIGLSVDSVRKRIKAMKEKAIFKPKVHIRPRAIGFSNILDIKIKLHNYSAVQKKKFLSFLMDSQFIAEIFSVSGEWDLSIVIISKDIQNQGEICEAIRSRFNTIIESWSESITTKAYKFETYDLLRLMGHKVNKVER